LGGIAGLFLSYWWDLPSGAAIVCTFGALLVLISFLTVCRNRMQRTGRQRDHVSRESGEKEAIASDRFLDNKS
jgi:hypothetical protein